MISLLTISHSLIADCQDATSQAEEIARGLDRPDSDLNKVGKDALSEINKEYKFKK